MNLPPPAPLSGRHWIVPAALLGAATLAAWFSDVDRAVSGFFYAPAGPTHWPVGDEPFWRFLYRWGELPAVLLAIAAVLAIAAGTAGRRARPGLRRGGAYLLIALVVGPLLITNGVLKGYYGRPRPNDVIAFGGDRPFQPVGLPTFRSDEDGFPSGHAAAGFALMLPYFVFRGRRPRLAGAILAGGLVWGGLIGFARIAQGGHFLSDVIWAAGVVYFTGYGAARWMETHPPPRGAPATGAHRPSRRLLAWSAAGLAVPVIATAYLIRLPLDVEREWVVPVGPRDLKARIVFVTEWGKGRVVKGSSARRLRLRANARGRGLPFAPVREGREVRRDPERGLELRYTFLPGWGVSRFSSRLIVELPPGMEAELVRAAPISPDGDPTRR